MAASEVEVVNSALIKLGEKTISDLNQDRKAARKAKVQYPRARKKLLRSYRWNFSITRSPAMAAVLPAPVFGFGYRFLLPVDCLRVLGVFDEHEPSENYTSAVAPFKVEGRYLLSDDAVVYIYYIRDVTDPTEFDAMFDEALATSLAIDLAYDLTSGLQRTEQVRGEYRDAIREARNANAIEGTPEVVVASDWTDSRYDTRPLRIGPVV